MHETPSYALSFIMEGFKFISVRFMRVEHLGGGTKVGVSRNRDPQPKGAVSSCSCIGRRCNQSSESVTFIDSFVEGTCFGELEATFDAQWASKGQERTPNANHVSGQRMSWSTEVARCRRARTIWGD
ncbi:hypothetical protein ACSQ67_020910 [Phaseolus vulgaris]